MATTIPVQAIKAALKSLLAELTGITPTSAYPWTEMSIETPRVYIAPPTITPARADSLGAASLVDVLVYRVYYIARSSPSSGAPDALEGVQETVLSGLRASHELRDLNAAITSVTSTIENDFTRWARVQNKPLIALSFDITIEVTTEV